MKEIVLDNTLVKFIYPIASSRASEKGDMIKTAKYMYIQADPEGEE